MLVVASGLVATLLYGDVVFAVVLFDIVVAILVVECVGVLVTFRPVWRLWLWGLDRA